MAERSLGSNLCLPNRKRPSAALSTYLTTYFAIAKVSAISMRKQDELEDEIQGSGSFVARALGATNIKERFSEHDSRAKCASNADTLEYGQKLLAHADKKQLNVFIGVKQSA